MLLTKIFGVCYIRDSFAKEVLRGIEVEDVVAQGQAKKEDEK